MEEEQDDEALSEEAKNEIKNLTIEEKTCLENFINALDASKEKDPKYQEAYHLLINERWIERGCIIFSQYYDSAYWVAENLSKDLPPRIGRHLCRRRKIGCFH